MASKRHRENNTPPSRDQNKFSILDTDPQPASEPPTRQTSPVPETRPATPQQDDDDLYGSLQNFLQLSHVVLLISNGLTTISPPSN